MPLWRQTNSPTQFTICKQSLKTPSGAGLSRQFFVNSKFFHVFVWRLAVRQPINLGLFQLSSFLSVSLVLRHHTASQPTQLNPASREQLATPSRPLRAMRGAEPQTRGLGHTPHYLPSQLSTDAQHCSGWWFENQSPNKHTEHSTRHIHQSIYINSRGRNMVGTYWAIWQIRQRFLWLHSFRSFQSSN